MEIITLESECIEPQFRWKPDKPYFKINSYHKLYFSNEFISKFKLHLPATINFINDEDEWLFYFDKNKDGFTLKTEGGNNPAALVPHFALAKMFLRSIGAGIGDRFLITKTRSEIKGHPIFKIHTDKKLNKN